MSSVRTQIIKLIEQGNIPAEKVDDALAAARAFPDGKAWRTFIDHLLLWLGGLALAFACLFFIAYNWDNLGRFAKFAMVELSIALAIAAYWKLGDDKVAGKAALLVATVCLGVLLAVYGQTYQTGADPWQLFFNWALLMLPWALVGRFPALWVLWVALVNLSIVLYHQAFRGLVWAMFTSETQMLWLVFLFNTLVLFIWEFLAEKKFRWLSERWALRLLAVGSGLPITWLVLYSILEVRNANAFAALVWVIWSAALYLFYRKVRRDLFMLAGGCLSGILVVVTFLARHILDDLTSAGFLILALLVIGLGTGAAVWLRNIHREWQL